MLSRPSFECFLKSPKYCFAEFFHVRRSSTTRRRDLLLDASVEVGTRCTK